MTSGLDEVAVATLVATGAGLWIVWLLIRVRRERKVLREALHDPDPMTRLAAICLMERTGGSPFTKSLRWRVQTEEDPVVRDALAGLITHGRWNRSWSDDSLELRIWANGHRAQEPAPEVLSEVTDREASGDRS